MGAVAGAGVRVDHRPSGGGGCGVAVEVEEGCVEIVGVVAPMLEIYPSFVDFGVQSLSSVVYVMVPLPDGSSRWALRFLLLYSV